MHDSRRGDKGQDGRNGDGTNAETPQERHGAQGVQHDLSVPYDGSSAETQHRNGTSYLPHLITRLPGAGWLVNMVAPLCAELPRAARARGVGRVDVAVFLAVIVVREALRSLGGVWAARAALYALGAVALLGLVYWHRGRR